MINPTPPECPYCGSASTWSSEHTEATTLGESHPCSCGKETGIWDGPTAENLDVDPVMRWVGPDPMA